MCMPVMCLQHPFMQGNLTIRYTKELLEKMNSPNLQSHDDDVEDDEPEVSHADFVTLTLSLTRSFTAFLLCE